jgi:hypothetical protein
MDTVTSHDHHHVTRRPKTTERVVPELTAFDAATPSAAVLELTSRAGTAVPGFPYAQATVRPGARWVGLLDAKTNACVAAALVESAECSTFGVDSGLETSALVHSVAITRMHVEPGSREMDLLPLLAYLALRRGRIEEKTNVAAYLDERGNALRELLDLKTLANLPALGDARGVCQRLDIAIHRAYRSAGPRGQAILRQVFIDEAVETLNRLIVPLLATPYFRAVDDRTLSREQYIYSLSNLHQFVRWTTRLLSRAVSLSDDPDLRAHFLNHLGGEVNHEVIIENDLAALGPDVDVDYVVHAMVPNLGTQEFMVVQESLIGFHEDPILFMAAPFAAEGFAANVTQRFITGLTDCARGWGVANPKKAVSFFASHVHFDGGDDGHWALTRDILASNLTDDAHLQQFVNAVKLAMNGFIHCYASYVDLLGIWTATPTAPHRAAIGAQLS